MGGDARVNDPVLRCSTCGEPITHAHGSFVHSDDTVTFVNGSLVGWSDYDHAPTLNVIDVTCSEQI